MYTRPVFYVSLQQRRKTNGFTLIEVLITVAIIGILAAVAYPSYTDYMRRSQLQEAFAALSDYRVKLEQYFQDHKNYGSTAGGSCADGMPTQPWSNFQPNGAKFFSYSCTVTSGGYVVSAQGTRGLAIGHTYTVDEQNRKQTVKFKNADSSKDCWLVRGGEC